MIKTFFWLSLCMFSTIFNVLYIKPVIGFIPALFVAFILGFPCAALTEYIYPSK